MIARGCSAALLLACMVAVAPARVQAQVHSPATRNHADAVSGRVLSAAGDPLANAVVSLLPLPQESAADGAETTASEGATVRTDPQGRYRFEPQVAGRYTLQASARGYLTSLYQQHDQFSTAVVLGAGLRTDALDLRLTKNGSIQGRVTDGYGDPVERATLTLYRKRDVINTDPQDEATDGVLAAPFRSATTDGTGVYDFNPLPPGTYYLEAMAVPWYAVHPPFEAENSHEQYRSAVDPVLDVAYAPVFYPHALRPPEASALEIKGGERIVANLQMQAEHALSLTITLPPVAPGEPFRTPQLIQTVFGMRQPVSQQSNVSDGRLQITGLVAGHYTVEEFMEGAGPVPRGGVDLVGGDAAFSLAAIEAGGLASASIHVEPAGGGTLPGELQVLLRGQGMQSTVATKVEDGGTAQVSSLAAGTYRMNVVSRNRRFAIVNMTADGKAVADHRLRVGAGTGKLVVAISVSLSATRLTGTVKRNGLPVGGTMVVLVPAGYATPVDLFRRDQSDLDGSFTLQSVLPGKYLLLAVENGWTLPWTDATAMSRYLAHAIPVVIPEGVRGTTQVTEAVPAQLR